MAGADHPDRWLAERLADAWLASLHHARDAREPCPHEQQAERLGFGLLSGSEAVTAFQHSAECAGFRDAWVRAAEAGGTASWLATPAQLARLGDEIASVWRWWAGLVADAGPSGPGLEVARVRARPRRTVSVASGPFAVDAGGRLAIDLRVDGTLPGHDVVELYVVGGLRTLRLARLRVVDSHASGVVDCRALGLAGRSLPPVHLAAVLDAAHADLLRDGPVSGDDLGVELLRLRAQAATETDARDWLWSIVQADPADWTEALAAGAGTHEGGWSALEWLAARVGDFHSMWHDANGTDAEGRAELERGLRAALAEAATADTSTRRRGDSSRWPTGAPRPPVEAGPGTTTRRRRR
jgi:hypothetical protein